MQIGRLIDNKIVANSKTLSINTLHSSFLNEKNLDAPDNNLIKEKLVSVKEKIDIEKNIFKKHRNKRLAHNDYKTHMKQANPLPSIQIQNINNIVKLFIEYLKILCDYFDVMHEDDIEYRHKVEIPDIVDRIRIIADKNHVYHNTLSKKVMDLFEKSDFEDSKHEE